MDEDTETQPPSDREELIGPIPSTNPTTDQRRILERMEAVNRQNEQDSRSSGGTTGSRRSVDSETPDSPSLSAAATSTSLVDDDVDLWSVWGHLVKNWDLEYKKRPQFVKDLVRQGIPCHFRTIAWQLLSGANPAAVHEIYAEYMRSASPHEKVIKRDISRTYPEHEFFKDNNGRGQQNLFNVMKAYSLHDREVGYCQGSAFIVGLLLLQMPEEEAFAVLLRLMEEYRLRELYKPAMTELGLCMFQLECLVQEQMTDLFTHFNNMGFDTSMYASSWFLTLFTTQLPLDLADRIMDVFISEGTEIVFRVALAILQQSRFELLQLDMEGMLRYFQRDVAEKFEADHDLLMLTAYQVKLNPKKMKKLEKDYLCKRTKEQEEAVELRRLRTENRLLRQRIEYLEQESEALAERLIKGQVNLAQEAENCISVSHQLHKLREINADAHRRLEDAYETIRDLTNKKNEDIEERGIQVDDRGMIEHIHTLQQELIETNAREADNENTIKDLKQRIQDLELTNKRLKETPPDHCVASLQEELISVKMREAEASLSLKEMRQRLGEMENLWAKYVAERCCNAETSPTTAEVTKKKSKSDNNNGATTKELEDQLMGVRIREADTLAELKEMRQKVMELETQNHVCTNQIRRQDEESKKLSEENDKLLAKEKEAELALKEAENKLEDVQSTLQEQSVMSRLKESELLETVTNLQRRVGEHESRKLEKWTKAQLGRLNEQNFDEDLSDGIPVKYRLSSDAISLSSEADFNLAEMTVKIPPLDSPVLPTPLGVDEEELTPGRGPFIPNGVPEE